MAWETSSDSTKVTQINDKWKEDTNRVNLSPELTNGASKCMQHFLNP